MTRRRTGLMTVFVIYCLIVFYFIFIGARSVSEDSLYACVRDFANFIPFKTIGGYIQSLVSGAGQLGYVLLYTLGNVLGMIPMGFLLPALFPRMRGLAATVVTASAVTFVLEFFQLMFKVGSLDIDCIILRGVGTVIGYAIYRRTIEKHISEKATA